MLGAGDDMCNSRHVSKGVLDLQTTVMAKAYGAFEERNSILEGFPFLLRHWKVKGQSEEILSRG